MALEMQSSVQRTRTRDGASRINFSLSAGALTLVGLAIVLVLGWCFYMGFMIGRGQNPEEHLQKIAAIWQGNNAAATAGQGVQAAGTVPVQAPGEVQTPGQLPAAAQMPGQTPAQASAQAAGKPVVPGQPVFRTSSATAAPQATAQATQPQGGRAEKATAKGPATYTYTYRMATVRSQQDARSEQERYEAKGFRVSIRKSGNSWALQHTFKGTDEDAAQFLRDVKSAGLGEPMRISRRKN